MGQEPPLATLSLPRNETEAQGRALNAKKMRSEAVGGRKVGDYDSCHTFRFKIQSQKPVLCQALGIPYENKLYAKN